MKLDYYPKPGSAYDLTSDLPARRRVLAAPPLDVVRPSYTLEGLRK